MKRLVEWTGSLLLGALVLVALFVFFSPRLLDYKFLTVRSGSMAPAIDVGSVVMVEPVGAAAIAEGDIITFRSTDGTTFVTHRVVGVEADGAFRTKGDANEDPDTGAVPAERLVGRVRLAVPQVGYLGQYVRTPLGFGLLIVVPAVLLIGSQLWSIVGTVASRGQKEPR